MVICHCLTVNDRTIAELVAWGRRTLDDVAADCGAGGVCGGCRDAIQCLLSDDRVSAVSFGEDSVPTPERRSVGSVV